MDESVNTMPDGYPAYGLRLADGACWRIQAGDAEAARIVTALAGAMRLRPSPAGETARELQVLTRMGGASQPVNLPGPGPAAAVLAPPSDRGTLTACMSLLALAIAGESLARGGLLIHGALVLSPEFLPGEAAGGVILAGPGSAGKSTACRRMPPPWHPLCDDTALAVRDARGTYWAHPWPTWSLFYEDGPGGCWETERAVPLRALFFLNQAPDDRVEPLNATRATASLCESAQQVSEAMARLLRDSDKQALHRRQLDAASALARAVPASLLHISLEGAFWRQIAQALPGPGHGARPAGAVPPAVPVPGNRGRETMENGPPGTIAVVYTGPSMNPTLAEPDVLSVRPYGDCPVRPGDVVCFRLPGEERLVVHRVVRVTPAGIRTRGDNNPRTDNVHLQPAGIFGRVVAAQRGHRRRRIAGGRCGQLAAARAGIRRLVRLGSARLLHGTYRFLADTGLFRRWLPPGLRPRLLRFQNRRQAYYKLTMGGRLIGRYHSIGREWHIRRPFRLWVDASALPRSRKRKTPSGPPPETVEIDRRRDSSRYWANPGVVCQEGSDGWAVLINSDTVDSLALNPTGLAVWRLVNGRRSAMQIAAAVRRHFHDVPGSVTNDVINLLDILAEDGFIGEEEPGGY